MFDKIDFVGTTYTVSICYHLGVLLYEVLQGLFSPLKYLSLLESKFAIDLIKFIKDVPRLESFLIWLSLTPKMLFVSHLIIGLYTQKPKNKNSIRDGRITPYSLILFRALESLPLFYEMIDAYQLNWRVINLYVDTGVYKTVLSPLIVESLFLGSLELFTNLQTRFGMT